MIYLISIVDNTEEPNSYMLFESHTESFFMCKEPYLKRLLGEQKITVKNIHTTDKEIVIKNWPHPIHHKGSDKDWQKIMKEAISKYACILICQTADDSFKLAGSNEHTYTVNGEELKEYIKNNRITNCCIEDKQYKSIDTYTIKKDIQFEKYIAAEYNKHVAITSLLGRKMSFDYIIEGREVKLKNYTGSTKDVIIPKFITAIMESAFAYRGLKTLILNEGLKYIGRDAFSRCSISKVTIPKSVEFMCESVFIANRDIQTIEGDLSNNINILNKDTVIIKKYSIQ